MAKDPNAATKTDKSPLIKRFSFSLQHFAASFHLDAAFAEHLFDVVVDESCRHLSRQVEEFLTSDHSFSIATEKDSS